VRGAGGCESAASGACSGEGAGRQGPDLTPDRVGMIKYIGSKRALLGHVTAAISAVLPEGGIVCDLFSGTARVGHALKKRGYRVWSNDHNAYAHALATCYVQADRDRWREQAERVLAELRTVKPEAGWFTRACCEQARFFHP